MREFNKISPALWRSPRFQGLPTDDARFAFLYLLTNAHQNSSGCYALLEGYACVDLGGWEPARYKAALAALVKSGMVLTDAATNEVLIDRWFKHNAPMNMKHRLGTQRLIEQIESDTLRLAAETALAGAWDEYLTKQQQQQTGATRPGGASPALLATLTNRRAG